MRLLKGLQVKKRWIGCLDTRSIGVVVDSLLVCKINSAVFVVWNFIMTGKYGC